ncbi:MAG: ThiF family adenylyltransferase [Acidobacteriota bacterium]
MINTYNFENFVNEVKAPPVQPELSWRAVVIQLTHEALPEFKDFCRRQQIAVIDTFDRQLADLALVKFPDTRNLKERQSFVTDRLAACGGQAVCGNWVYLPWEKKVAHLLSEDDYFEVITNRNQDKITRDEQQVLRTKRIGVIGLSVGGEAAVTVAQEHLCGEIRLADFDRLDLSNLNRLNAGFDELGTAKVLIAARRIARINPYLEVRIFDEGVTAENAIEFLDGLDLLIEECDHLQVKRDVRQLARGRDLNVIYAADERGFLSIEPYQYCADLRPFHGRAEQPQPPRQSFPTPLAFMQALALWLGGWENLSKRSQGSLERIGQSLCGYPQLASEARYAAGQLGHVARRLLLGEKLPPFIGNLDLAELI